MPSSPRHDTPSGPGLSLRFRPIGEGVTHRRPPPRHADAGRHLRLSAHIQGRGWRTFPSRGLRSSRRPSTIVELCSCFAIVPFRHTSRAAPSSHNTLLSTRCVRQGRASPIYSANCQPFLRSAALNRPSRHRPACCRGSGGQTMRPIAPAPSPTRHARSEHASSPPPCRPSTRPGYALQAER